MQTIHLKSFLIGVIVMALGAALFFFRDDLFTRQVTIEIFDQKTNQTSLFAGSGTMQIIIQYPQMMTDWKRQYEIHAYRKRVFNGTFRIPARFYKYVQFPGYFEAGCVANFSFEGRDISDGKYLFCQSIESSERKNQNAIVVRCD